MKKKDLAGLFIFVAVFVGAAFSQEPKKAAYGVLLDNTGTMRPQLSDVKTVGKIVARHVNSQGVISVFGFLTEGSKSKKEGVAGPAKGSQWSRDSRIFDQYIDDLSTVPGQTALIDAILFSAESINTKVELEKNNFSEKVLVIVTDGEDRVSRTKPKELISFLKENQIRVYAIALVQDLGKDGGLMNASPQKKSTDFLKRITTETGGRVIFPKAKQSIQDVVDALLAKSATDSGLAHDK